MRTCRECRCTDAHGCAEGCFWVEADLCSSCAVEQIADHELIRAPLGIELPIYSWLAVHGNLLLALRRPENTGKARQLVEDVVAGLEGVFLDHGILTEAQLATMHQQEAEARPRIILPGA